jgi:hypothetical protein
MDCNHSNLNNCSECSASQKLVQPSPYSSEDLKNTAAWQQGYEAGFKAGRKAAVEEIYDRKTQFLRSNES